MLRRSHLLSACLAGALVLGAAAAHASSDRGLPLRIKVGDAQKGEVPEEIQLYADSHALVIGIDDYTGGWPRLSNAVRDAKLIAATMEKRGFDVKLVLNATSEQLTKAFEQFFILQGQNPEARLFVWYAGHGHTERGEGFLVPADAPRPEKKGLFRLKALALRRIGEYVRMAEAKHAFAVFDSCFSGTVFDSARALPPSAVTRATTLPVRQFLTSGDAGQTVSDDGAFRELFLRALDGEERADANGDGYVTASEMGMFLTDRVTNLTRSKQTPRYGKLRDKDWDRGDFVFTLPQSARPRTATTAKSAPTSTEAARLQQETAFWESIKDSGDSAAYKAYLEQYPQGAFARLAQVKLDTAKRSTSQQRSSLDADRKRLEEERKRFAADAEQIRKEQAAKLTAQMEAERKKLEEERAALARQQQLALATPRRQSSSGGGDGEALEGALTGDQIKLLHAGAKGFFNSPRTGAKITVAFSGDGTMTGATPTGKTDEGTWWTEEDRFCRKWRKFAQAKQACFKVKLDGNNIGYFRNANLVLTTTLDEVPEAFTTARR